MGNRIWRVVAGAAVLVIVARGSGAAAQAVPQSHVLIVSGASGEPRFATLFHAEAMSLRAALTSRAGIPDSQIVYLAEDPAKDPSAIGGRSNRDGITQAVDRIAARARPGDAVLILLLGHGSSDADSPRFNVPGPDLSAADFSKLLERLARQHVAFVNATSASGDFVKVLAGPSRIIVTATKSGFERNETLFSGHFVAAFARDGADTDKDGRVSLLEAFTYARREVQRAYEQSNRLQTEHAMLDDNGDGTGSTEPGEKGPDGARARSFFLGRPTGANAALATDPRAADLLATQRRLQAQLDSLRLGKAAMPEREYEQRLEDLLLKLAETSRALRALEPRKP